jgi:two-component system sensor histidine kinase PrrB
MRRPRSLAGRVTLAAVAAVGAALLIAGVTVVVAAGRSDRDALDRELVGLVQARAGPAQRALGPPRGIGRLPPIGVPGAGGPPGGVAPGPLDPGADRFVRAIGLGGTATSSGASVPHNFPLVEPGEPRTVTAGGERWRTVTRGLPGGGMLQVAARLEPLNARSDRLRRIVIIVALAALAATALAAGALARAAVAPLARLRDAAGHVAETADLDVRVPADEGPVEVRDLAGDLNAMLERLGASAAAREAALEAARRFAADAGHELRTPLTSLRANLSALGPATAEDAAAHQAVEASERDAVRLAGLVEQLQALARGEAGPPAAAEAVDIADLVDSALAAVRTRHPGTTASLDAPDAGPVVHGDAEGLRILVDNLVENAARHGREHGSIAVRVATGPNGGATVTIDDDGPGIPAAERAAVLRRFTRGSGARGTGTGLGLAIARAQAERHGGDLRLDDAPGGGLRAVATLRGTGRD